jgi:hypothetical protein
LTIPNRIGIDQPETSVWIGEDAMIFRLSQELNTKIKAGTLPALPLDLEQARSPASGR